MKVGLKAFMTRLNESSRTARRSALI